MALLVGQETGRRIVLEYLQDLFVTDMVLRHLTGVPVVKLKLIDPIGHAKVCRLCILL
jgi:hypothetical protein